MEDPMSRVSAKFPDAFVAESSSAGQGSLVVEPSKWMSVASWLSSDGGFSFLSDLCAVDWLGREPRFEVVYNLTNFQERSRIRIKLPVGGDPPKAPSVTSIWPTANWFEREAFDLFGINFEGHPDLSRILMPDEWEGHPLRKDYAVGKVPIDYKQMSPGFRQ